MGNCGSCSDLWAALVGTREADGVYDESTPMITLKTNYLEGIERAYLPADDVMDIYRTTPQDHDSSAAYNTSVSSYSGQTSSSFHFNYELKEEIGVGSTSKCYNCIKKSDGLEYACKVIDKRQVELKFSGLLEQFFTEIKVLKALQHPNIIRFEDTYETNDRIYIVMELMKGGELFDYVVEKGTLSEEEASLIVRKITSAVAHMHGMNIIHRDLKPENLLLTSKGPDAAVKLIDFGLAKVMRDTVASSFLGGFVCSCRWPCLARVHHRCWLYTYCRHKGVSSSRDVASTLL